MDAAILKHDDVMLDNRVIKTTTAAARVQRPLLLLQTIIVIVAAAVAAFLPFLPRFVTNQLILSR